MGNLYEAVLNNSLLGLGKVFTGYNREAEHIFDTSLSVARQNGNRRLIGGTLMLSGWLQMGYGKYTHAEGYLQESIRHYRKLKHLDELGWALATLGYTSNQLGNPQRALELLCEALRLGIETRAFMILCHSLAPLAVIIGQNGDLARSQELYAAVCQNPVVATSVWFKDLYGRRIDGFAEILQPEVVAAAQERGRKRDLWETAAELLEEMEGSKSN